MRVYWKRFFGKTGLWLATEVWLNLLGLDNLADYGEFVFARELELYKKNHRTVKVAVLLPQFCIEVNEYCPVADAIHFQSVERDERHQLWHRVIQQKCKKLQSPCIKIWCLPKQELSS